MGSLRKSLQRFAEDLQLFSGQLSQETQELRRNVEARPITGATNFRHCLEDINDRLAAVGEELQALESVSLDAISLEELVGHCVALYQQNHAAIEQLEQRLQQYGYRDVYAPLPPENPLDMLMLRGPGAAQQPPAHFASPGPAYLPEPGEGREPLEHITNSLAAASLQGEAPGSAQRPRTVVKAMAPMTAAKTRARADTPSSLSSPYEAMSPSMRELLGKYASSSGGPPTQYSGTPFSHSTTPPVMGQLSPAFAAARLASEQQQQAMAAAAGAAELTPAGSEGRAHTPEPSGTTAGWQADPSMYTALTATAKKLASKPDFMEQYRQRFPHIVASTERLLASVEKQPPPEGQGAAHAATAAVGGGGPMTALAAAATAAAVQQQQQGGAGPSRLGPDAELLGSRHCTEEETTMQLYSQVISSRAYPMPGEEVQQPGAQGAHGQMGSSLSLDAHNHQQHQQQTSTASAHVMTPSTEMLLSRAFSATARGADLPSGPGAGVHPIASLRAGSASGAGYVASAAPSSSSLAAAASLARTTATQLGAGSAAGAEMPGSSNPRVSRSRPDLQEAIEAALRRSTVPQATMAAPAAAPLAVGPAPIAVGGQPAPVPSAGSSMLNALDPAAAEQPKVALAATPAPPRPPTAVAATPATQPLSGPQEVPPLRLVAEEEYASLPTFIKGQLSLEQVNNTLATVHAAVMQRAAAGGTAGFTLEDLEGLGISSRSKVFINSIVKLGRAHLKVMYGQGTIYLLL